MSRVEGLVNKITLQTLCLTTSAGISILVHNNRYCSKLQIHFHKINMDVHYKTLCDKTEAEFTGEAGQNIIRMQLQVLSICMHKRLYTYICKHFTLARGFTMEKENILTGVERSRYFKLIFPQFVSDRYWCCLGKYCYLGMSSGPAKQGDKQGTSSQNQ